MTSPAPRTILEKARRGHYAIGAFNVSSLVVIRAIVQAAQKMRAPVIIETSSGETQYIGAEVQAAILAILERQTSVPILVNLDHAKTFAAVKEGIAAGYELIHFDGSELPKSRNIALLKRIVPLAHRRGLLVEGELDHIVGSSEPHGKAPPLRQLRRSYTDPDEAADFVERTGIDLFASFIGNLHGVYRRQPPLDLRRLSAIAKVVPAFLSLHGGSGIPAAQVRGAIRRGIVKVNVNTELRIAYVTALRRALRDPRAIVPYVFMPPVIAAVQRVVEQKIKLFGSAGTL